jgi:hypothetical protein
MAISNRTVTAAALSLAFLGTATAMAEPLTGDHAIVPGVRIGAAELAPADQGALVRELGEPDATDARGDHTFYRYGIGYAPSELVVDFDVIRDEPFEIFTASPAYRTKDGLGIGSNQAAIRAALGAPLCQGISGAGDGVIVYETIWFRMAHGAAIKVSVRRHLEAEDFRAEPTPCR